MQEVNLLSEEFKPSTDPFTLKQFAFAWALLLACLLAMTAWQLYTSRTMGKALVLQKNELNALTNDVANLRASSTPSTDPKLVALLANLTSERNDQRRLVSALKDNPPNAGFSSYLGDLASIHMRNLWFDSISLKNGGEQIQLHGFSKTAELVPQYLSELSAGQAFAGYSFDGLEIDRESNILVSFEVTGPKVENSR